MRVLIGCEYSGIVRDAFAVRGHDAWSCDILDSESKGNHIKGNVLNYLDMDWQLAVFHPPCTHLSVSGARWFTEGKKPIKLREDALDFVQKLMDAPIDHICIENPVSVIYSHIRQADQTINPYQFGHTEYKKTCLWLKNLPLLKETNNVLRETQQLPDNITKRIWYLGSGKGHERSKFYTGIASAMAEQWGDETNLPIPVEQLNLFPRLTSVDR